MAALFVSRLEECQRVSHPSCPKSPSVAEKVAGFVASRCSEIKWLEGFEY